MITFITAMAAAAVAQAAQPAPAADPHAQHMQMGERDHSKMDHSQMAAHSEGCCKQGGDGKMECSMPDKGAAKSANQGHSGH